MLLGVTLNNKLPINNDTTAHMFIPQLNKEFHMMTKMQDIKSGDNV
jgi:hypothetical protein